MKKKHGKIHHYIDFMQNMQIYAQNMHKHYSVVKNMHIYAKKICIKNTNQHIFFYP